MRDLRTVLTAAAAFILFGGGALAWGQASTDTFQADTVGSPPANWSVTGTNGTDKTGNVASEGGGNQFLAIRDTNASTEMNAVRTFAGANSGFIKFDIRFNAGVNNATNIFITPSSLQPIQLTWQHNANNTSQPLNFLSRGNGAGFGDPDPNANASITGNFPIGSWQTVTVFFKSIPGGVNKWGNYSVSWNGFTQNYLYLNQGGANTFPTINTMNLSPNGSTNSIDIDNVTFVPEPTGGVALMGIAGAVLVRRRARR